MTQHVPVRADPNRNVLIVDDEVSIADAVSIGLRDAGYTTTIAENGASALNQVRRTQFALIVLDVMLPDGTGFDLAARVRVEGTTTPILFLTARDTLDDKLLGLQHGDDYLTKPFMVPELVARVAAILRRSHAAPGIDDDEGLRVGDLHMNVAAHTITRAGDHLRLTATEFRLLEYFMTNPQRVLSKQQILDAVWGYTFDGDDGVVETYVRYLRRKLDAHGPPMIETIRLVGYVLRQRT